MQCQGCAATASTCSGPSLQRSIAHRTECHGQAALDRTGQCRTGPYRPVPHWAVPASAALGRTGQCRTGPYRPVRLYYRCSGGLQPQWVCRLQAESSRLQKALTGGAGHSCHSVCCCGARAEGNNGLGSHSMHCRTSRPVGDVLRCGVLRAALHCGPFRSAIQQITDR
jgi:hypothetical protein